MQANSKKHVTVVGGGLVGPMCACYLAKRGYNVDIYEYRDDMRKTEIRQGRSINMALSVRARSALRDIGLEETILDHGIPMRGRMLHSLSGKKQPVLYDKITKQCIYSVERKFLNELLLCEAEKFPNVRIFFNHKLINVRLEEGELTFENSKGVTKTVTTDLIIGADGAFSTVRRYMQTSPLYNLTQTYIEHGYLELKIPPGKSMEKNYLHIWPRGEFMMISLPNQDGSWTVTLFMPFARFQELTTAEKLLEFFYKNFPDYVPLIGEKQLVEDFFQIAPSSLVSIKCHPYHYQDKVLLIGDAAHAMVPFYGQGTNCGFEDCRLLDSIMESFKNDIEKSLAEYTRTRKENCFAICELAMYNYEEMRDLVTTKSYHYRKKLDEFLYWLMPNTWVPLYNTVTFTNMDYKQCIANRKWQNKIISNTIRILGISALSCIGTIIFWHKEFIADIVTDSLQTINILRG